ncbi:DUF6261 family protein [Aquimarina sp. D1M17]|uniref:DUF6261 family protein n=1 Tax=Aquimarina acroporae TaxID=2937283 RepID=UPI0020BFAD49|nr:DUF6261 family protein [Aquimarina acroporae]MCK8523214.1 DUF6261 family protein [Aquimarina acroporae]
MFSTPQFSKFRNSEFMRYVNEIKNITTRYDPKNLNIVPQIIILNDHFIALHTDAKKQVENTTSDTIEALDKRRDLAIIGMQSVCQSYTYHYDPEKRAAARVLLHSFDQCGKIIIYQNHHNKTDIINRLCEDWEKISVLKNALITLKLNKWAQELIEANSSFNWKYLQQKIEFETVKQLPIDEHRKAIENSYFVLLSHISVYKSISNSEDYDRLINDINHLTLQYNQLAEKRIHIQVNSELT